jgi:uncharacterized protein (TIGR02266 family)
MPDASNRPVKCKILVVDDAPMFRELESLFLARTGRVFTASSGEEALDIAQRERPDIVVADYSMPGMSGSDLCRRIKADPELHETPVVIVLGSQTGEERACAIRAGADDVIEKPLDRLSLIQSVNRLLRIVARGLERVDLDTEVRMNLTNNESWGRARNVSRGGMFIEAETDIGLDDEIEIEFQLPNIAELLMSTGKVVWRRTAGNALRPGIGLQFLMLDRASAKRIEDFVHEYGEVIRETVDEPQPVPS